MSMGNRECEWMLRRAQRNVANAQLQMQKSKFEEVHELLNWIGIDLAFIATEEKINGPN